MDRPVPREAVIESLDLPGVARGDELPYGWADAYALECGNPETQDDGCHPGQAVPITLSAPPLMPRRMPRRMVRPATAPTNRPYLAANASMMERRVSG